MKKATEEVLANNGENALTPLGTQWFYAEAVGAWVRIHVKYYVFREGVNPGALEASSITLSQNPPSAFCGGFTNLVRDLCKSGGLNAYAVPGETRPYGETNTNSTPVNNHAWACVVFNDGTPDDFAVPIEATQTRLPAEEVGKWGGKTDRDAVLPKREVEWEIFLSVKYALDTEDRDMNPKKLFTFTQLPYSNWSLMNSSYYANLANEYHKREFDFNHRR